MHWNVELFFNLARGGISMSKSCLINKTSSSVGRSRVRGWIFEGWEKKTWNSPDLQSKFISRSLLRIVGGESVLEKLNSGAGGLVFTLSSWWWKLEEEISGLTSDSGYWNFGVDICCWKMCEKMFKLANLHFASFNFKISRIWETFFSVPPPILDFFTSQFSPHLVGHSDVLIELEIFGTFDISHDSVECEQATMKIRCMKGRRKGLRKISIQRISTIPNFKPESSLERYVWFRHIFLRAVVVLNSSDFYESNHHET